MLIGGLLRVGGWIPQSVPQGRSGLVWARGVAREPLDTLSQSPAASGQQEVMAARHFEILLFEVRADDLVTMPAKKPHSKGGVGTGWLTERDRYVASLSSLPRSDGIRSGGKLDRAKL